MRLFELAQAALLATAIGCGLGVRRGVSPKAVKAAGDILDDLLVLDSACGGNHHGGRAIGAVHEATHRVRVLCFNRFRRAQNTPPDRGARIGGFHEHIEHDLVGRILIGADFLQNDAFFPL